MDDSVSVISHSIFYRPVSSPVLVDRRKKKKAVGRYWLSCRDVSSSDRGFARACRSASREILGEVGRQGRRGRRAHCALTPFARVPQGCRTSFATIPTLQNMLHSRDRYSGMMMVTVCVNSVLPRTLSIAVIEAAGSISLIHMTPCLSPPPTTLSHGTGFTNQLLRIERRP